MPRAKAFSGKKKKQQLREQRERKRDKLESATATKTEEVEDSSEEEVLDSDEETENTNTTFDSSEEEVIQGNKDTKKQSERKKVSSEFQSGKDLKTIFARETDEEVEKRKQEATIPLDISKRDKPWNILAEYIQTEPIDFPKRPMTSGNVSPEQLEKIEKESFQQYAEQLNKKYSNRLNYFEHNIEVWRQLWMVCERSNIVLLVTDARFPLFHFPPALYNYVIKELKKKLVLVLNKQDLVDDRTLTAWQRYFNKHYPELKVIAFSAFQLSDKSDIRNDKKRKLKGKRNYQTAFGVKQLLEAIVEYVDRPELKEQISKFEVEKQHTAKNTNTKSKLKPVKQKKEKKIQRDEDSESDSDSDEESSEVNEQTIETKKSSSFIIGTVGHPNVGKSSLINGMIGKKVVSTSRTPGHTKHFQTIPVTEDISLMDCPGLVFPALDRPKPLQILCGLFPIAQVREPFSAIRYLAERLPLEQIYGLKLPDPDEPHWSPYSICEAYATKRSYFIARTGRADVHRAGLEILYDCLDGKLSISWPPPDVHELLSDGEDKEEADEDEVEDEEEQDEVSRAEKKREKKLKKKKQTQRVVESQRADERKHTRDIAVIPPKQTADVAPQNQTGAKPKKGKAKKSAQRASEWADKLEARKQKAQGLP